jgi:hypothetical protein
VPAPTTQIGAALILLGAMVSALLQPAGMSAK